MAVAVAGCGALAACSAAKPAAGPPSAAPNRATARAWPAQSVRATPTVSPIADACALATAAQVSTAFGGRSAPGVGATFALVPICEFALTGAPLGVSGVQIWALVNTDAGAFQGKQPGGVAVGGVGDAAYYFASLHQLTLIRDGHAVLVRAQFNAATPAPADPSRVQGAETALGRDIAQAL